MHLKIFFLKYLDAFPSFMCIPKIEQNMILKLSNVFFLDYPFTQKGYKCNRPPKRKFYVYVDVTFVEHDSCFHNPYL